MMATPGRFLLLVLCLAAALASVLVPRTDEWFAVLRDQDKQAQIVAQLEPRLAQGDNDPKLLATLGRAHADLGDTARATELLERYVALQPQDADAYGRLAELYGAAGETARQREALERSVALAPKLPRVAALAAFYHARQDAAAERATLARFAPDLTLQSGLLLRLAQLDADSGDKPHAIALLSRPEIVRTLPKEGRNDEERLLLAALLAETGQAPEAVRLGKAWIAQWREPWLANRLLTAVTARAPAPEVFPLADAVAELHPAIRLFLVKTLTEQDAPEVARHLLRTWHLGNPRPTMNELAGFLSACREWGEPAIVWDAFGSVLGGAAAPEIVARYVDAVAAEFGIHALAPFWSALPPEVLEGRPLLAARLAFAEGDTARARWLAGTVNVASLSDSDQRIWIDLLRAVASSRDVFATLRTLRQAGGLPRPLLAQYAQLAGGFGEDSEYAAALAALRDGK